MDPDTVSMFLEAWGYSALLPLVLTGVGSPIPEGFLLATSGHRLSPHVFWWPVAIAITWGAAGAIVLAALLMTVWLRLRREGSWGPDG
jgi:hypothetical protein